MTIPTDDLPVHLRLRLERELDALGPTPDHVGPATVHGARVVRRRRLSLGAVALTALVAAGAGSVAWLGGGSSAGPEPAAPIATDPVAREGETTPPDALADGRVTAQEWTGAVSQALTDALPGRYGPVTPISTDFDVQMFGTEGGDPRLQASLSVNGWHRAEHPVRYGDHTCAAINALRELWSCTDARFGDGWQAVVTTDLVAPGNAGPFTEGERVEIPDHDPDDVPDDWMFGTVLTVVNDDVVAELRVDQLGADGLSGNDPAGISDDELVALAQDPAFLDLLRVGVQWWYDQPRPRYVVHDGERHPVMQGWKQQVPPRYPD